MTHRHLPPPPFLTYLEGIVAAASGLDDDQRNDVRAALRSLGIRIRSVRYERLHEPAFAFAIARYGFSVSHPEASPSHFPVRIEDGSIVLYRTEDDVLVLPAADIILRPRILPLLGLTDTVASFERDHWKCPEYHAAAHSAAAWSIAEEDTPLAQLLLRATAWGLVGLDPERQEST